MGRVPTPRTPAAALSEALAAVAVWAAAAALAWYRLGPVARGTAWAEDGGLFLRERLRYGVDGTLLRPYAGYLHLLPRLIVDLGVHRPVEQYAITVSAASCVFAGVVAASVFAFSRLLVPAWPPRLLLAAVPVVLPLAPFEISGTATNLHWYMLVLVPWLFSYRACTWWGSAVVALLTLVAVLTEPLSVLFLPLLLLAWFPFHGAGGARSGLRALPVSVVALTAAAAQTTVALTTPRASEPGHPTVADVTRGYLLQPVPAMWVRDLASVGRAVAARGWWLLLVPVAAIILLFLVALVLAAWRARVLLVALGGGSVAVWTAALLANASADAGWGTLDAAGLGAQVPTRYAAAAGMLLLSAVALAAAVLVDPRPRPRRAGARRRGTGGAVRVLAAAAGWCVVTVVVAAAVMNVAPGPSRRSNGPEWAPQVDSSVDACRADPATSVSVKTAPWGAEVPCALVLRDR